MAEMSVRLGFFRVRAFSSISLAFFRQRDPCCCSSDPNFSGLFLGCVDASLGALEYQYAPERVDFSIPVLQISVVTHGLIDDAVRAMNYSASALVATVNIEGEASPWRKVASSPTWWFFSIFIAAISCFTGAFAFIRIREQYLAHGSLLVGVPQAVLYLDFFGCLCTHASGPSLLFC